MDPFAPEPPRRRQQAAKPTFPKPLEEYHDEQIPGVFSKLAHRVQADPFNPIGTFIFFAAIIHTFLAPRLMQVAHRLEHKLHALVPGFSDNLKYAVVAGAVAGGGLTVIANASNPAGQSILVSRFGDEGISALRLFLWTLFPTVILGAAFMLLR